MKIRFIALVCAVSFASSSFAQSIQTGCATQAVKNFYRFHLSHDQSFSAQPIQSRSRFFAPKLRRMFWNELKREHKYGKKHPTDKPQFTELPFQPIEFRPQDLRVGAAQIRRRGALVKVDFGSETPVSFQISLVKSGEKWEIDDVIYNASSDLTDEFATAAKLQ